MKYLLTCFISIAVFCNAKSQQKKDLYFLLEDGNHFKNISIKNVTIKTTRLDTAYSFTIPLDTVPYSLLFFRSENPEIGKVNLPIITIKNKELKKLKYTSLDELVKIMKANDDDFDRKYNLYFVEKGKVNYLYHVFKLTSFGDYAPGF